MPRFADPIRLGETINTDAEEGNPVVTPDGTMFFVRSLYKNNTGGKSAGQDIWMSKGNGSNWSEAVNVIYNLNNNNNNAVIGVSRDGKRIYVLNQYAGKNKMKPGISYYEPGKTENPVSIDIPGLEPLSDFYGFYMHPDEKILLISAKLGNSTGEEDIYVSLKDNNNKWSTPINIGTTINTSNYEISPFLADTGDTLYYSTAGRGGYGSADVFMTVRLDNSWKKWSIPVNLGNKVNSKGFDAYFTIHGNLVYFASNRNGEMADIYNTHLMTLADLDALLPESRSVYFVLNGYLLDGAGKETMLEVVKILEDNPEYKVILSGYTCSLGNETRNQKLSEMRAGSVMDFLAAYGITVDRIELAGYGESKADVASQDDETQKKFRRVDIKFGYLQ